MELIKSKPALEGAWVTCTSNFLALTGQMKDEGEKEVSSGEALDEARVLNTGNFVSPRERQFADWDAGSEILFTGDLLKVGKARVSPEPRTIKFLHRVGGGLQWAEVHPTSTLNEWWAGLVGDGKAQAVGCDGYLTTKGGLILNSALPVAFFGVGVLTEVVYNGRVRGGGYGGRGKGAIEKGPFGDWTCGNCGRKGCWSTRYTCYRCGHPRYSEVVQGGNGKGGMHQDGVSTGMGGVRIVGANGRDQQHVPGGDPTQRRKVGGNKVRGGEGEGRVLNGALPGRWAGHWKWRGHSG